MSILYIYNHCPYCIKTRLVADLSLLDYELVILANDDEISHINRIGCKQVPFLETNEGVFMKESNDICKYISNIQKFDIGQKKIYDVIKVEMNKLKNNSRNLVYPRVPYHKKNKLDFPNNNAIKYFINKNCNYIFRN